MAHTVLVAGSTNNTVTCAQALHSDDRFTITGVISPEPKPVGRQQVVTQNPLHQYADELSVPTILIKKSLGSSTLNEIKNNSKSEPDFLLVVDFGYLIPTDLLSLPTVAPLNIHPSALPRWRGSAPGQFALLYGETESAVTLMVMNEKLDQGAIVSQYRFTINNNWNQADYYQTSFDLISKNLADDMTELVQGNLTPTPQPTESPTPLARQLTKDDAFIDWETVTAAMAGETNENLASPLLNQAQKRHNSTAAMIEHAARALDPWPQLWTKIPTSKGKKRMKILRASVDQNKLILEKVHIAGQQPAQWNQVKNILKKN